MTLHDRRLRIALLGLVLAGCLGASSAVTGRPSAIGLTIATAPGVELRFDPADATIAAGPIELTFRNRSSQAHNLVFTGGLTAATRTIVEPGEWDLVAFSPPGPGTYPFACTIHEGMRGSLRIEAPAASTR